MPEVGNQFCVITISRDIRPNILIEKTPFFFIRKIAWLPLGLKPW